MPTASALRQDPITARVDAAIVISRQAGELARSLFVDRQNLKVDSKGVQDRVTNADRQAEQMIRDGLGALFPQDGFLGEEYGGEAPGDDPDAGTWVVDPIDGTDCFVFGMPSWCVSLAWVHGGETKIGIVFDPVHDEMFTAAKGRGAYVNGEPIRTSAAVDSRAGLVGIGHSLRIDSGLTISALDRLFGMGGMFHRCGSGALSLAWVAAGRLIGYYEAHMNAWDCLAGMLLVREAGGWTNDFLEAGALQAGNFATAAAPGMIDQMMFVSGLAGAPDAARDGAKADGPGHKHGATMNK